MSDKRSLKGYDAAGFVKDLRAINVTPHIAQNDTRRRSAIDRRTTRHPGYAVSQQKRKRIEEPFGWGKTIGGLARPMLRGLSRLGFKFTLTMAAYNLIRLGRRDGRGIRFGVICAPAAIWPRGASWAPKGSPSSIRSRLISLNVFGQQRQI